MFPTQVRGSTLVATLAAVLLGWCAIGAPASGHYGLHASFDGAQFELRLALPAICVQVSAVLLEEASEPEIGFPLHALRLSGAFLVMKGASISRLHSDDRASAKAGGIRDTSAQDVAIDPRPAQLRRRKILIASGAGALLLLVDRTSGCAALDACRDQRAARARAHCHGHPGAIRT